MSIQKWAKHFKKTFSKDDLWMAKKNMKRCSLSLIIREMQIRSITRYYFTPLGQLLRKNKIKSNKSWQGCEQIWTLVRWWQGCEAVWQPRFLTNWKTELPAAPLLGTFPKQLKSGLAGNSLTCHSQEVGSSQTSIREWTEEWINKMRLYTRWNVTRP